MRKRFPGYYRPSEAEFGRMWQQGLFVLDASFLLDLFRYSDDTANSLLRSLTQLEHRVWIPHQAGLEYHRNLTSVIEQAAASYEESLTLVSTLIDKFKSEKRGHPFLDSDLHKDVQTVFGRVQEALKRKQKAIKSLLTANPIKERLADLLDGKVGEPFSDVELQAVYADGEKRFKLRIPPGFSDAKKPDNDKYGDLVLWRQILAKAKETESALVFVTADAKEDWFLLASDKSILGPHPQLTAEIRDANNILFYIYPTHSFLKYSEQYLAVKIHKQALEEVRKLENEKSRRRNVDIHSAINLEALKRAAPALYEVLTNSSTTTSSQPSSMSPALLAKLRAIKRAHPSVIETLNRHLRPTNVSSYSPAGTAFSALGLPQHILSDEEQLALRLNPDAVALALDLLGSEIAPTNIQQETQAHDDSPHQDNEEKR